MYNMINISNTDIYIKIKRVNPKSSHPKDKYFFYFFNVVAMR